MPAGAKRILMISDHSDPLAMLGGEEAGGQNVYVDQLSDWLAQKGHTVHVLTRQNSPDAPLQETAPSGYTVFRTPLGPSGFLPKEEFARYLPEFTQAAVQLMQQHAYDVIHSHYWLSGMAAVNVRQQTGVPVVHTFHSLGKVKHHELGGAHSQHRQQREDGEMRIVQEVDCLLAESSEERRLLLRYYQADSEKITVIPAGVDTHTCTPGDQADARQALGIQAKYVVLYVGRLVAQKGIPTLIQAFAQVLQQLSPEDSQRTVLLIAGGNLREATQKQSRIQKRVSTLLASLHLEDKVQVVGQVDNDTLPRYYQAADVTVVPSRYEPFGIVPLESMACGTPVVASYVGGMKTTVRNLYTGLHARPSSSTDFAYKIRLILQNPALRADFRAQAREHVENEFSWESVCDRILICYTSTIAHAE